MKNGLMSAQVQEGVWLPLLDYAHRKGLSLSTLRRYIKASKVTYRSENGRYLIWDPMGDLAPAVDADLESLKLIEKLRRSEADLRKAREEIAELKTLIAFYEDIPTQSL